MSDYDFIIVIPLNVIRYPPIFTVESATFNSRGDYPSTGGIGFAIVQGLASSGVAVVINGRSDETITKASEKLLKLVPGATVYCAPVDLSSAEGVKSLLDVVPAIDILVNNAGTFGLSDFFETDDETRDRYWQINVMTGRGVRLSRALASGMAQKGWGRIVFISSESARNIPEDRIHCGVTKTSPCLLGRWTTRA